LVSSIRYRVFNEGSAIKINKIAGAIVQIVSISCPSLTYLLKIFLLVIEITNCKVKIVIIVKMIIAWSWKNKMCSMEGETVSWKEIAIQIVRSLDTESISYDNTSSSSSTSNNNKDIMTIGTSPNGLLAPIEPLYKQGGCILIELQRWYPIRLEVSSKDEMWITKDTSVGEIKLLLSQKFGIPIERIAIAKPRTYQLKDISQLPTLPWDVSNEHLLSATPFYIIDGDILLFKDCAEEEILSGENINLTDKKKRRKMANCESFYS